MTITERYVVTPPLPFTEDDLVQAWKAWKCNCGPAALAACLELTLDALRPRLGAFESKGYMSPTMMKASLWACAATFSDLGCSRDHWGMSDGDGWPTHGLVRVQFGGPWTAPGSNPRWAYNYTHWIHSRLFQNQMWVFDVNSGWLLKADWARVVVPLLTREIKRADGKWWTTHLWQVQKGTA